jgi:cyclopropane-fatty-acyl-phospholipid synthase
VTATTPQLRTIPAPRGTVLRRVAMRILERALADLHGGLLEVELPDGSVHTFGSGRPVRMTILSDNLFQRLALRGKLGLGESYQAGEWQSEDLAGLMELLFRNADTAFTRHRRLAKVLNARPRPGGRQGLLRARRNIRYHYDLGNELFELMLDETMTYSCAVFEGLDEPLADAQRRKLRRVCDKLELGPGDHLLEIGCGWGSFALMAAGEYGARVTGLTISAAQASLARERVRTAGLDQLVEIVEEDYRLHAAARPGSYTKLASIEMIEAIGQRQFPVFFAAIDRLLEPGGLACIQSILIPDHRFDRYRRSPDWIERYVVPGCLIPSLAELTRSMASSSVLTVESVEEIGLDYAETLRRWRANFHAQRAAVRALGYGEHFERTWDFYLGCCEGGFRSRALRDAQLVLSR